MAAKSPRFIHLRTHSEHSLLEGAIPVGKMPAIAAEMGMPAVALTDTNNMFAALEFSVKAKDKGVQPIIGCQVTVQADATGPMVLLAQNRAGWMNLMALSSCIYLREGGALPHVTLDELCERAEGLICLTGGAFGPLGQLIAQGQGDKAAALAARLGDAFGDRLYVELQRHPGENGTLMPAESASEAGLIELAYARDLPLVATNDVYFPKPAMYEAHDALICIAEKAYVDQSQPRRRLTPQHYFKSPEEMCVLFADLPEALENTVEIARRCAFAVSKHAPILPKFADDEVAELRRQANEGLQARLKVIPHAVTPEEYQQRLDFELNIIEQMGFPGYFLIVADFIGWAKEHDIPVGPGRGSGAGSLVAYALTITDLDPLRYSLLFERFLNPERVSMPDFDIDFCMDRREEVIRYVQEKYGKEKVGQIITFGALLSKAAVRDVGRVLQLPFGQVDRLSKMIPVEGVKPVSITKARAEEPRLREAAREEVVGRLLDYAEQLEGLYRNASTHAAGVVIGDRPLDQLVPLYRDPASDMPATQFNMKWVEQAGLVKFDFLGLKTLTVIQNAVDLINGAGRPLHVDAEGRELYRPPAGTENQINTIPLDDKASYDLFASARTVAVFQVESSGMMDALRRMRPTCIEDIVALVALYRPGPMENIPVYCDVKNGARELESIHPSIDHILAETQGIIVYQEQVMQIAQVMAGYSLGGADLLRRAMGKKIAAEMAKERPKFIKGSVENGVPEKKAGEVFDLLEKFANYGFNKSHAAAYAVVSYQTAWLKANHPVEFMAAVMNCDIHLTDKLAIYKRECDRMGIEIVPPCVNRSAPTFTVGKNRIYYALGALKGVGIEAMRLIHEARGDRPFRDITDFARRVDMKRVGKRPLEMLARAGAFDLLDDNRARVLKSLDGLVAWSAAVQEQAASNQSSLFGGGEDLPPPRPAIAQVWLPTEKLGEEHKAVGFYLSGHPLDDYQTALRRKKVQTLAEISAEAAGGPMVAFIAGTVAARMERKSAKGTQYAFVSLSDPTGLYEVTLFSDLLNASRDRLEPGLNVVMQVKVEPSGEQVKMLANSVAGLEDFVADAGAGSLAVEIQGVDTVGRLAETLGRIQTELVAPSRARGPVRLRIREGDEMIEIEVANDAPLTTPARQALRAVPGVLDVIEE
ncbi:DNA polymerase III subunit alpha [Paracoccus sp. 1_MG-2023]|uniref:DNA polymerase III subunit alpha n=1 Tax=unclassified Paracoccus (in: a-proteobacteria) TaxID=2688777 RepID=UPI001C096AE3|nr:MULTISPECIES: DNA polymerase III subunit alpha [unclassified Paracoccus (in: a-proteobacteria)]MBU2957516.1 DNA polymerase III subunit alpha [Paracoccus sp. C2R09]MDO6670190.1 DNA polymerase III subunit alpha [Paracoccus sp. 1_MG-2023]